MQDIMVGLECEENRSNLEVSYPISNGIVKNWEDMKHVWDHAFEDRLQVKYRTYRVCRCPSLSLIEVAVPNMLLCTKAML